MKLSMRIIFLCKQVLRNLMFPRRIAQPDSPARNSLICLTHRMAEYSKDPQFCIRSTYDQPDGGRIEIDEFPFDNTRATKGV